MKRNFINIFRIFILLVITVSLNPASSGYAIESVSLVGQGASFPDPLIQQWAVDFYEFGGRNVRISYTSTGSGGGISGITNKEVIFAASDAPLNKDEYSKVAGELLHIPFVLGAIVLIYNIPGFDGVLNLTADNIAHIFQGNITSWTDPELLTNNEGLPTENINVVRRADSSGTTYAFTDYLQNASSDWVLGKSKKPNWESLENIVTIAGNKNSGVQGEVESNSFSIGYVGLDYALITGLGYANIQNADGQFVKANLDAVSNTAASSVNAGLPSGAESWENVSIVNQQGSDVYPISTFSYLLVYNDVTDNGVKGSALIGFLKWLNSEESQKTNELLHYSAIPVEVMQLNNISISSMNYDENYNPDDYNKKIKFTSNLSGFTIDTVQLLIIVSFITPIIIKKSKKRKID